MDEMITKKTRLLVISPHPDDEVLGCGGLIGKCYKESAKIMIVYICVGHSRQLVTKSTNADTRLKEIEEVRQNTKGKIKILYTGEEFTRLDMVPQKDLIEKIEDIIQEFKPTIVTVPSSSSYNQDHRATFDACITALRPTPRDIRYFTPTVLEYFEPYLWMAREAKVPNAFLDLSEKIHKKTLLDFKLELYKCHKTQVRKDPFPRSVENLIHIAHVCGKEIGVSIAEAYHVLRMPVC